ncbi:MAG: DUF2087 domain-containing protein [Betaproteobacteria bacterium]
MTGTESNPFLAAFRRLAITQGLLPGALQSGRQFDFVVVTAAAIVAFTPGRDYSEREVNAILEDWLAGPGAMLATDHVELRRLLIDCRLLARDGYGRRYGRTGAPEDWREAMDALGSVDLVAEAALARKRDGEARAHRKAQWEKRPRPEPAGP